MAQAPTWLRGVGTALITPFIPGTLEVDMPAYDKLLAHVLPHTDFLVVNGTTGEAATLTFAERQALLRHTISRAAGKPVVYGWGGNNTRALLEELKQTDTTGVAAFLSVSPYYNRPGAAGLQAHYTALADAAPAPIILYNVPSRTGSNIGTAVVAELSRHPNICGLKEAHPDLQQVLQHKALVQEGFALLCGDDALTPAMIAYGAVGVIGVMPNVLPRQFHSLTWAALEGRFAEAARDLGRLLTLNNLLYAEGNPVGIKAAVAAVGIGTAAVRLPLAEASDGLKRRISEEINGLLINN